MLYMHVQSHVQVHVCYTLTDYKYLLFGHCLDNICRWREVHIERGNEEVRRIMSNVYRQNIQELAYMYMYM